jgi:hypothetical protein
LVHLKDRKKSLSQLAREVEASRAGLRRWFQVRGRAISSRTLELLANVLEIPAEQALEEAGGITAEQRQHQNGQLAVGYLPEPGSDAHLRNASLGGRALRGRKLSPEHVANREHSRMTSGGAARSQAGLAAERNSVKGRARLALFSRLLHEPTPSRDLLKQWRTQVAEELQVRPGEVAKIWRTYERVRDLIGVGGRHSLERRHELIDEMMEKWPRSKSGRLARGFWPAAAQRVARDNGKELTYQELQIWWHSHPAHCALRTG